MIKADIKEPEIETWGDKSVRIWFNKIENFRRTGYVTKKDNIKVNITTIVFP